MHFPTILSLALTTLSLTIPVDGASHERVRAVHRRRHASRANAIAEQFEVISRRQKTEPECENGSWKCVGTELQRCYYAGWHLVQNCTGENIICSADDSATGCIWTWSLPSSSKDSLKPSSTPSSPSGTASTPNAGSLGNATLYNTTTGGVLANHSLLQGVPSSTVSAVVAAQTDDEYEYGDCDEGETTSTSSSTATETSAIGGNLYVGQHGGHRHSTTDWYGASATGSADSTGSITDSMTASVTDSITGVATDSVTGAVTDSATETGSITASITDSSDMTAYPTSTAKHGHKGSSTVSSVSPTHTSKTNTSTSTGSFEAPHYVIYSDSWLTVMPSVQDLAAYNRFILAFWMSNSGAVDNAQAWEGFTQEYRQNILQEYHDAGIALMVSAFGSTDTPTTSGTDPKQVAQDLAAWVIQYGLDGVDIDYEDMGAMNNDQAEAWLITFQTELRNLLPSPMIISHAPVAPWFTSANDYASGAYVKVHKDVGDMIDFYNIQFYNQGNDAYVDCDSLINDSGNSWPSTSVFEINSYAGVPLDKIVIGKPLDAGAATNGYMSASDLAQCVIMAENQGWNGGCMFWEWTGDAPVVMATVRGM